MFVRIQTQTMIKPAQTRKKDMIIYFEDDTTVFFVFIV